MGIHRSYFYYTEQKDDSEVEAAIRAAAEFGDGFWKIFQRLRREGKPWNHKKVYRVYKQMHNEKRSKLKKRLPARDYITLNVPPVALSIVPLQKRSLSVRQSYDYF